MKVNKLTSPRHVKPRPLQSFNFLGCSETKNSAKFQLQAQVHKSELGPKKYDFCDPKNQNQYQYKKQKPKTKYSILSYNIEV